MRLLIALFATTLVFAQDKPAETPPPPADTQNYQAEIITVKTLTGDSFDRLMKLLAVFGARIQAIASCEPSSSTPRRMLSPRCAAWSSNSTVPAAKPPSAATSK